MTCIIIAGESALQGETKTPYRLFTKLKAKATKLKESLTGYST